MRKLLSLALTITMLVIFATNVYAKTEAEQRAAEMLYNSDIIKGTGVDDNGTIDFSLDTGITRAETVTILIRLLGEEENALKESNQSIFKDVTDNSWYNKYVTYAYKIGLSKGISDTQFAPNEYVTANQFVTFILRLLGYKETDGDFTYTEALQFSDELGITNGEYNNIQSFDRGNVVTILVKAVACNKKGTQEPLLVLKEKDEPQYITFDRNYGIINKFRINDKSYISNGFYTELKLYKYENELYMPFDPILYIEGNDDIRVEGAFIVLMSLCNDLYEVKNDEKISIDLRPYEALNINIIEQKCDSNSKYSYTYKKGNKSLIAPQEEKAISEIEEIRFVRDMSETWYVNVNDIVDFFKFKKAVSVEEIEGQYWLIIESK